MLLLMGAGAARVDRRQRRRLETIEEVLDVALEVMAEQGVAGLSIGEVARRMGIKPPSLYVYFDSKNALYDALFGRGAQLVLEAMQAESVRRPVEEATDAESYLLGWAEAFCGWAVEHAPYSQLLFWRPVPGFRPSERAYAAAVELTVLTRRQLQALQDRGLLRPDVSVEDAFRDWTILSTGVISQQLSNEPGRSLRRGTFTARLHVVVAMFAGHYGVAPASPSTSATSSAGTPARPTRRARHADSR